MGKLYNTVQIAGLVGVSVETIRVWESRKYIPESSRVGLRRKRVWSEWKLQRILEFASDNGYIISERPGGY